MSDCLSLERNQGAVFQTSLAGGHLAHMTLSKADGADEAADFVINSAAQISKIIGFGGALTDATAINVIYSYNAVVDDFEMKYFSIDVDKTSTSNKLAFINPKVLLVSLGPLLKAKHPDVELIIMDDQKSLMPSWNGALQDPEARQYVDGVSAHWYMNLDFVSKTAGNFAEMSNWQQANPDLFNLAMEACEGYLIEGLGTGAGTKLLQPEMVWKRGEVYARDIVNDLANYATGWMDWNLVLDTKGGPTWVESNVDSPILVDEVDKIEFYKQSMYYVMGHFSKFQPPGSVRVKLELSVNAAAALVTVDRVAFFTPGNQVVFVLHNRDTTKKVVRIDLASKGRSCKAM
ncbi:hypothetical protein PybrP1_011846 [[Pythium] brassicae (nom. inval.)]|nr:hypothetical protein PybrP1_011846 [[Pythium] brassicae (nom. inval.)]